jgi:hypothetical protein
MMSGRLHFIAANNARKFFALWRTRNKATLALAMMACTGCLTVAFGAGITPCINGAPFCASLMAQSISTFRPLATDTANATILSTTIITSPTTKSNKK